MDIAEMTRIGSGAQADVYRYENNAFKIFKPGYPQADAQYEADIQNRAHRLGLPVPAVYAVTRVEGRAAISMTYLEGKTLVDRMLADPGNAAKDLDAAVDLQIEVHHKAGAGFPCQKDKLKKSIAAAPYLECERRKSLLRLLESFETDDRLCHGDFHALNLMWTPQGMQIIDWVDASSGSALADVCRSYLLYLLYRPEIAQPYLEIYCSKANVAKQRVLMWLPVIAGARLSEMVKGQDTATLLKMAQGNLG